MTESERKIWTELRNRKLNGLYFRRQHPFGIYIIDFYCFEAGLAIEIDGDIHDFRFEYDIERTSYLENCGLKVLRFRNSEVLSNINNVLEIIKSNSLSPLGETGKGVSKINTKLRKT